MNKTYITTEQLSERIHYHPRTIRHELVDRHLFEGRHYIRAFGRRMVADTDIAISMPIAQ
jgi:hypothetical protein